METGKAELYLTTEKLHNFYYSPSGYYKGLNAVNRLHKRFPRIPKNGIQNWLDKQDIYQIYKPLV